MRVKSIKVRESRESFWCCGLIMALHEKFIVRIEYLENMMGCILGSFETLNEPLI